MRMSCRARPRQPGGRTVPVAGGAILLAGCTPAEAAGAGAWFAPLALLVVGVLSAALAAWVVHARRAQALRETREALRHATVLQADWSWHTDRAHQVVSWAAPGQAATAGCAIFDAQQQRALFDRLRSEQPFSGLRLQVDGGVQGMRNWRLSGVPVHDASGAFAGFEGRAQATDDWDQLQHAAAALPALLGAFPAAVLTAEHDQGVWRVCSLNAEARRQWSAWAEGQPLDAVPGLGAELAQAADSLSPATPTHDLPGWRLVHAAVLPRSVVLLQQAPAPQPASPAAPGPATVPDLEGDTFSFTLSHDLRAPLRAVEGFTRIVKEDYGRLLDRVGNDHLDRVLGAAARMNLMIDALLKLADLSRQPLARQRVNLSQLATYVVDDLRRNAPERAVEIDIEPQLAAWGDPTLLRLVLENLLGNAWKYTGRCTLAQISLRREPQGDGQAFVVRDNGAGFDMRSADRLFSLFQRLHSASDFPGHGVGLASVRRIVRRHGGDIWAEAEPGRGAAFYFTLPG
jgi:signal transduction histidine kinase